MKGAAKRLTFSLLLASALAGCAVYEPPYETYPYGQPVYPIGPDYVGPPVFFNFGFESGGGHHHHRFHGDHHGFSGGEGSRSPRR